MLVIDNKEHFEKMVSESKENGSWSDEKKEINSLKANLAYLDNYGCNVEYDDPEFDRSKIKVHLGYDWTGFSIYWTRRDKEGEYQMWMNGGLIYHETSNSWSVHT